MKIGSCQNISVLGFVDPEIFIVFRDHQFMNGLYNVAKRSIF